MVLQRREGSIKECPEDWGEGAYICDPFDNKSYPAYQYTSYMKGCSVDEETGYINERPVIEQDFFEPAYEINTSHIMALCNQENLNKIFDNYIKKCEILNEKLNAVLAPLLQLYKYEVNLRKKKVMARIIAKLTALINDIANNIKISIPNIHSPKDYFDQLEALETNLTHYLKKCKEKTHVDVYDAKILNKDDSLISKVGFFCKPTRKENEFILILKNNIKRM